MKQNSPFNWQGKPSIFTREHDFNGVNHGKSLTATVNAKNSPVSLPGGSKELRPEMMRKPK